MTKRYTDVKLLKATHEKFIKALSHEKTRNVKLTISGFIEILIDLYQEKNK